MDHHLVLTSVSFSVHLLPGAPTQIHHADATLQSCIIIDQCSSQRSYFYLSQEMRTQIYKRLNLPRKPQKIS